MYSMRGGDDPREKYNRGVDAWILKNPILAPVIGFVAAVVVLAVRDLTGIQLLLIFAILILIVSILLLIYGLVRKVTYIAERRKAERRKLDSNREKPDLSSLFN